MQATHTHPYHVPLSFWTFPEDHPGAFMLQLLIFCPSLFLTLYTPSLSHIFVFLFPLSLSLQSVPSHLHCCDNLLPSPSKLCPSLLQFILYNVARLTFPKLSSDHNIPLIRKLQVKSPST